MDKNSLPLVSVILTTYKSESFIEKTIDSLLSQTYENFELIIIDDCSPDNTSNVISKYTDKRIKLYRNESNIGVSLSRNKGIAIAKGKYIAPSDHDDLSLPNRLIKQVEFLEANPQTVLLATEADIIVNGKNYQFHKFGRWSPTLLHWMLYFKSPIVHSSVCFRRQTLVDFNIEYRPDIKYADDFDLYHQFAHHGDVNIIPESLIVKYEDGYNASFNHYDEMIANGQKILFDNYIQHLGIDISSQEISLLWNILNEGKSADNLDHLFTVGGIINNAARAFFKIYGCNAFEKSEIETFNSELWLIAVLNYAKAKRDINFKKIYNHFSSLSIVPIKLKDRILLYLTVFFGKERVASIKKLFIH